MESRESRISRSSLQSKISNKECSTTKLSVFLFTLSKEKKMNTTLSGTSTHNTSSFAHDSAPNAAKLIESLRHLGYDNYHAIADIVDNSIDAELVL